MKPEEVDKLVDRKLKQAQTDHRVSKSVLEMTDRVLKHLCREDVMLLRRVLISPQTRRRNKAANAILFWQDREAVDRWLSRTTEADEFIERMAREAQQDREAV